jgi:hypothetical protein
MKKSGKSEKEMEKEQVQKQLIDAVKKSDACLTIFVKLDEEGAPMADGASGVMAFRDETLRVQSDDALTAVLAHAMTCQPQLLRIVAQALATYGSFVEEMYNRDREGESVSVVPTVNTVATA